MKSFLDAMNTGFTVAMLLFALVTWPQVLVFWWRKWRKRRKGEGGA